MSDMSPDAKSILDAARDGDDPTRADDARTRKALVAQLGVGLAVAASTTASTTAAAAGAAGAGAAGTGGAMVGASSAGVLLAKILVGVALVGGIGAGGVSLYASRAPQIPAYVVVSASTAAPKLTAVLPSATPNSPTQQAQQMPVAPEALIANAGMATATATATTTATATATVAPPTPTGATAAAATARTTTAAAPAPHAGTPPPISKPAPSVASTLDDETRLVRDADAALRGGDASGALALLDQHARTFPHGVLAEERAAERVLVLCALGRTGEARTAAASFLRDRPLSPLATRIRSSCAAP